MPANVLFSSFLSRNGNPKSEEELRNALHMSKDAWNSMVSSPVAQRALSNYQEAQKAGNGPSAFRALGNLVSNNPELADTIINGAGYGNTPGYIKDTIRANTFGLSYKNSLAYGSTLPGQGAGNGGLVSMPEASLFDKIAASAKANGVPLDVAMATIQKESNFNPNARAKGSTATGLGQVVAGTAAQYGYSQSDMLNPDKNLDVSMRYLKAQLDATNGNADASYQRYHFGPGSGVYNEQDSADFERRRAQYAGTAEIINREATNASGSTAQLGASRYADETTGAITVAFTKAVGSVDQFSNALDGATHRLGAFGGTSLPGFGAGSPATGSYGFDVPGGGAVK